MAGTIKFFCFSATFTPRPPNSSPLPLCLRRKTYNYYCIVNGLKFDYMDQAVVTTSQILYTTVVLYPPIENFLSDIPFLTS